MKQIFQRISCINSRTLRRKARRKGRKIIFVCVHEPVFWNAVHQDWRGLKVLANSENEVSSGDTRNDVRAESEVEELATYSSHYITYVYVSRHHTEENDGSMPYIRVAVSKPGKREEDNNK